MAAALSSNTFFINLSRNANEKAIPSQEIKITSNSTAARTDILGALTQLEAMTTLKRDWDSYGSEPPTPQSMFAARMLIVDADRELKSAPYFVAPVSGGGVQLEWRGSYREIEVEVDAHGRFGYLLIDGKGSPKRKSKEGSNLPRSEIIQLIKSVTV